MLVKIANLNKNYGKKQILYDFNTAVELQKGKIIGIIGPNGAGKTTFLKVVSGILGYDTGLIEIDDYGKAHYQKWCKNHIVLVNAGDRGLRFKSTVKDNVLYFCALKGVDLNEASKHFLEYSEMLYFTQFSNRKVETLSTGEMKKANLLCGLCANTDLIILDEPSSGLDIDSSYELQKCLQLISSNLKSTLIISSHNVDFLSTITSDFIFIMNGKNVMQTDSRMSADEIKTLYFSLRKRFGLEVGTDV